MQYCNEEDTYGDIATGGPFSIRKWMILVLVALLAALSLLWASMAHAQMKEGTEVTGTVAICDNVQDAATLLGIVTTYGQQTGMGFTREDSNTCAVAPVTFIVGAIEIGGMKDREGMEWIMVAVRFNDKNAYIVVLATMYVQQSSF